MLTKQVPVARHAPQQDFAHLTKVDGIIKEAFWVVGDADALYSRLGASLERLFRTERMRCARLLGAELASNTVLGRSQRVKDDLDNVFHGMCVYLRGRILHEENA